MPPVCLHFHQVRIVRDHHPVVEDATAHIPPGRVTALVGPNGAGKSTLIDALLGFLPYTGAIQCHHPDGTPTRPRVGFVPQRFTPDRHLPLTTLEFLACAQQRLPLWLAGVRRPVREQSLRLLAAVHAEHVAHRALAALSGGELQRVLLANALLRDPELLILDEPGAGVDAAGEGLFCELLEELRARHGFTQLMVSHNIGLVTAHAFHVVLMNRRVLAEGPPETALTEATLERAFGVHMTRWPRFGPASRDVTPCCVHADPVAPPPSVE